MPLSDIVNVVITRNTQGIQEPGFGTLLILGTSKKFNERIRFYSNMDGVAEDFSPTDPEYIAAQDVFAQDLTPSQIAIGRRDASVSVVNVVTAMNGQTYTVTINGIPSTLESSTPDTVNSTLTLSADFVEDNVITTSINGVAIPTTTWAGTHAATMTAWANEISNSPLIDTAVVDESNPRRVVVTAKPAVNALFTPVPIITLGASQATVTVATTPQPVSRLTVAAELVALINANTADTGVVAVDLNNGFIQLTSENPAVPYTLSVSTNIGDADRYLISVTQAYADRDYFITINGIKTQITTPATLQNNEQVAAQLTQALNANLNLNNIPVSVIDNGNGTITVSASTPGTGFTVRVSEGILQTEKGLAINALQPSGSVIDDLDAINQENNQWYALASIERDESTVLAIAGWVESRIKLFGTASADPDIINLAPGENTSIAGRLSVLGYARTFVMYHQDANSDYPECAWFGRVLPLDPGSETWKFKTLRAIPYSQLSTTQSNNVLGKNANTYESIAGRAITQNGTVAAGEFIDIIRGIDWLTSTIQTYVFLVLANSTKVPYTDSGIAVIEAEVRRALQRGIDQQFISDDPEPIVTVPKAANVPLNDKANRILRNVRFQATLTGAIHAVEIRGNVTV